MSIDSWSGGGVDIPTGPACLRDQDEQRDTTEDDERVNSQHQLPYQRVRTPLIEVPEVDCRLLVPVLVLWSRHGCDGSVRRERRGRPDAQLNQ